jgi:hypothetical protein
VADIDIVACAVTWLHTVTTNALSEDVRVTGTYLNTQNKFVDECCHKWADADLRGRMLE